MFGKMGWERRGRFVIAGMGITMVLFLSWRAEVSRGDLRDIQQAGTAVPGETRGPDSRPVLDVTDYDRLLRTNVTADGWVDYVSLARERGALNRFLEQLGKASPNGFKDNAEQLAFWIDSYNAFTLADALDMVYGKHQSVRQVGGFFDGRRHLVAGEQLTLDEIEKHGRELHDPRIHFAIVCASASCPRLQRFAYTGQALDNQLDQAAREFLADQKRGLRFDPRKNELYVSPILKWYAGDFTGTSGGSGSMWARVKATVSGSELLDFIARYAPAEVANHIKQNPPMLRYFDYDWSLNSLDSHVSGAKP